MREETLRMIASHKLIAIVRGIEPRQCEQVAEALYNGGIRLLEITFDQRDTTSFPRTAEAICQLCQVFQGKLLVGAGTVLTEEQVELAAEAGARFLISPDTNEAVIRRTRERGLVSIPGALTPTEILAAHRTGADYVKLFPVTELGSGYVKALRAPLSHINMLAVGGIQASNVGAYLSLGLQGAGVGGNLVNKGWIEKGEFEKITAAAAELVAAVDEWERTGH